MDNIVPTPAEFIFLARLYHAHKQGYVQGRPTPPPCYKRLSAHGFIDFVSGNSVLNTSKQWVFSITDDGIDHFLFWLKSIIVVVATAISTARHFGGTKTAKVAKLLKKLVLHTSGESLQGA